MVLKKEDADSTKNGAMVYLVDKKHIPKGIKLPRRPYVIKTVGSIKGLPVKRSDRKLIVTDISTPERLTIILVKLKKSIYTNGYTSIAIVKQGDMSFHSFHSSVDNILGDIKIDIETYNT